MPSKNNAGRLAVKGAGVRRGECCLLLAVALEDWWMVAGREGSGTRSCAAAAARSGEVALGAGRSGLDAPPATALSGECWPALACGLSPTPAKVMLTSAS